MAVKVFSLNERGFTLTEVSVAALLSGLNLLVLTSGLVFSSKFSSLTSENTNQAENLVVAERFIRRVGRVATACKKETVATIVALDCDVDKNSPPNGVLTKIRFIVGSHGLLHQEWDENLKTFKDKQKYSGISELIVCDSNDLKAGTCKIPGGENELAKNSPRYFRYQLKSATSSLEVRSAFFVRNPSPFGAGISFEWGS